MGEGQSLAIIHSSACLRGLRLVTRLGKFKASIPFNFSPKLVCLEIHPTYINPRAYSIQEVLTSWFIPQHFLSNALDHLRSDGYRQLIRIGALGESQVLADLASGAYSNRLMISLAQWNGKKGSVSVDRTLRPYQRMLNLFKMFTRIESTSKDKYKCMFQDQLLLSIKEIGMVVPYLWSVEIWDKFYRPCKAIHDLLAR